MTARAEVPCDCFTTVPWPALYWLHIDLGLSRYYLCRRCGTIREDFCRPDGTVVITHFHHLENANLPSVVVEQAQGILARPRYRQLSLF
jgi:hypothetical protein